MGPQSSEREGTYQGGVVDRLWSNYLIFRRVSIPSIESRTQLPLDPTKGLWGTELQAYLDKFINLVWKPALIGDDEKKQRFCLYLGLCIWDPFRRESHDNWALIEPGINEIKPQFDEFLEIIEGRKSVEPFEDLGKRKLRIVTNRGRATGPIRALTSQGKIDAFYLFYRGLIKEVASITVKYDECPYPGRSYKDLVGKQGNATIKADFDRAVDAHFVFTPKRESSQRYVYYIPTLLNPTDSNTGIGGLILISTASFSGDTLATFQTVVNSILGGVGINYLYRNFYDQSARSAISSIMSRNMSHNIGSHVIPRATVDAVKRRLADMDLWPADKNALQSVTTLQEAKDLFELEESGVRVISDLKGRLDEYTQRKSDFLAEITTEALMTTRSAFFYREVLLPLVENSLFMDNIAANEGVRYRNKGDRNRLRIHFHFGERELKAIYECSYCKSNPTEGRHVYPESLPYSLSCPTHPSVRLQISSIENGEYDPEVELPGPLGEFALYSFLENYIRNVAKHNKAYLESRDLDIHIRIDELDRELNHYRIRIWDNVVDARRTVNINVDGVVYRRLDEAIAANVKSPIIHSDGSLKRQAWGLGEMKICSVLLRGPQDFVAEIATAGHSINVGIDENVAEDERLVYDFTVMRSRSACLVLPQLTDKTVKDRLRNEGIWVFNHLRELSAELNKGAAIASFRFALFDCTAAAGNEGVEFLEELRKASESDERSLLPKLPFRILLFIDPDATLQLPKSVQPIRELPDLESFSQMRGSEILQWLWSKWMCRWLNRGAVRQTAIVNIYLEQSQHENPTKKWAECAQKFNAQSDRVKLRVYEAGDPQVRSLCDLPEKRNTINVIYDRHRGLRDLFEGFVRESKDWSYILLEKSSPDFTSLFWPKFPYDASRGKQLETDRWILPWELAEAGLLRLLVIDERAAEFSMDTLSSNTHGIIHGFMRIATGEDELRSEARKWHLAWAAKIYICTHFGIDCESEPIHERIKNRKDDSPFLKVEVDRSKVNFHISVVGGQEEKGLEVDAVLIHQGVLDDWRNRIGIDFDQTEFLQRLRSHFPFVVVESGRGIPPNLSNNEKFLPFSLLQHNVFGDNVGKFGLNRMLMSLARRRGREAG